MKPPMYQLYWEDIGERLLYAELDDYSWKLAEQWFGYRKIHSLYIYHNGKLAAFFSQRDADRESEVGYKWFQDLRNVERVITHKRKTLNKILAYQARTKKIKPRLLTDDGLNAEILTALNLWNKALCAHFLSQPQFFHRFEKSGETLPKGGLERIGRARFAYTRRAFTIVWGFCKKFLGEYATRNHLTLEEVESLRHKEIMKNVIKRDELKKRSINFAFTSHYHTINQVYTTEKIVHRFIDQYENYDDRRSAHGIIGNRGKVQAPAFVLKNENLNFKQLPMGMKQGMVLIVQNAWPELVVYYKKASALVTNEGGITSHGVVVSREFGIPCVVATRIATKIFNTGDMIEVDAEKGVVQKIS